MTVRSLVNRRKFHKNISIAFLFFLSSFFILFMLLFFDLTIGRKEKRSYSKFKIEISSKKILKIGAVKLFSIYVNVFQIFDNEN